MKKFMYNTVEDKTPFEVFHQELLRNVASAKRTYLSDADNRTMQLYCIMQSLERIRISNPDIYHKYTEYIQENNLMQFKERNSIPGTLVTAINLDSDEIIFDHNLDFGYQHELFSAEQKKLKRMFFLTLKVLAAIMIFVVFDVFCNPLVGCISTTIVLSSIFLNKKWLNKFVPHYGISSLLSIAFIYAYLFIFTQTVMSIRGEKNLQIVSGILIGFSTFLSLYSIRHPTKRSRSIIGYVFRILSVLLSLFNYIIILDLSYVYLLHPPYACPKTSVKIGHR